jgi:uncharacterized Tic20 family protein
MSRLIPPGMFILVLTLCAGVWLVVSPFALQSQPVGGAWIASTVNNVATGGVLFAVSLIGILAILALSLRDLVHAAAAARAAEDTEMQRTSVQ